MVQRIFSSMTRQKEELAPLRPGKLGIYVCGVTPYDYSHVGHARVYVVFDTVVRWLRRDHHVTYVRNFTDVEDKIIKRAKESGEEPLALAERFAQAYLEDMAALSVGRADVEPRVSTHMAEIIEFIRALEDKGFAYRVPSATGVEGAGFDVYFRVRKMDAARYLQLSGRSLEDMRSGARVAVDERKDDPLDFALWKSAKAGEIFWDSPWGKGRPGWHIECSAMSAKHLGVTFDIHGGGKDLLFPHHTNEIAQSECRHDGAVMSRIWMHNGFVNVEAADTDGVDAELVEEIVDERGQRIKVVKMSKSLGNFFTIREVLARYTPEALRTLLLSTHYRSPIAFSERLVEEAERRAQRLHETRRRVRRYLEKNAAEEGPTLERVFSRPGEPFAPLADFQAAMEDDFNTPKAFAAQNELLKVANLLVDGREKELTGQKLKPGQRAALLREWTSAMERIGAVLGVGERDADHFLEEQRALGLKTRGVPEADVRRLLDERAAAKAAKDYASADQARAALGKLGVEVRDTPDGVEWNIA
ncbi:MAG: cysteine--tRNA ligase [Deltaproteobacteria bacterium]|nr:cysteine--tRNA ligase [Deltaproteobacteria bacterium]